MRKLFQTQKSTRDYSLFKQYGEFYCYCKSSSFDRAFAEFFSFRMFSVVLSLQQNFKYCINTRLNFLPAEKNPIRSSLMTIYLSQYLSSKVLYMFPLQELVCHLLWSIFSFPLLYFPFTDLWKHTSSHYCFNFLFRCDSTFTVMRFFMGDALATYEFIS